MTESCTCGARVPEDARFCHKCGRPLVELIAPDPDPEPVPAPEEKPAPVEVAPAAGAPPAAPPPIGFRNPGAVRIGMFVAAAITLLMQLMPLPGAPQLLWMLVLLLAGGFVSVYMYHRRTGDFLTVRSGARLGWMTGLFSFLILMVLFTLSIVALSASGGFQQFFRDQVAARGAPDSAAQIETILETPALLGTMLFFVLFLMFMMLTVIASVGGALAAKVLEKE